MEGSQYHKHMGACPICREPLPDKPPSQRLQYCSRKCAGAAKRTVDLSARPCEACGKQWTPKNRYQATRNKTCSQTCANALISKARLGMPPANKGPDMTCPACGKTFHRSPTRQRKNSEGWQPTCSKKCRGVQDRERMKIIAANGRAGWTDESKKSYAEKMSGDNNPAWKGGVTYRKGKGNYIGPRYVRCPDWALPMARKDGYVMEHRLVVAERIGRLLSREEVVNHINHNPRDNRVENLELYPSNADHKRGEAGRFVAGVANRL